MLQDKLYAHAHKTQNLLDRMVNANAMMIILGMEQNAFLLNSVIKIVIVGLYHLDVRMEYVNVLQIQHLKIVNVNVIVVLFNKVISV